MNNNIPCETGEFSSSEFVRFRLAGIFDPMTFAVAFNLISALTKLMCAFKNSGALSIFRGRIPCFNDLKCYVFT